MLSIVLSILADTRGPLRCQLRCELLQQPEAAVLPRPLSICYRHLFCSFLSLSYCVDDGQLPPAIRNLNNHFALSRSILYYFDYTQFPQTMRLFHNPCAHANHANPNCVSKLSGSSFPPISPSYVSPRRCRTLFSPRLLHTHSPLSCFKYDHTSTQPFFQKHVSLSGALLPRCPCMPFMNVDIGTRPLVTLTTVFLD